MAMIFRLCLPVTEKSPFPIMYWNMASRSITGGFTLFILKVRRLYQLMLAVQGRIIVIGMGKSGHIARKIAATLASTGSRVVTMPPSPVATFLVT